MSSLVRSSLIATVRIDRNAHQDGRYLRFCVNQRLPGTSLKADRRDSASYFANSSFPFATWRLYIGASAVIVVPSPGLESKENVPAIAMRRSSIVARPSPTER